MEFEDIVKACAKHVDPPAKKVIAGAPDRPLVIGDIEVPCYVLEGEVRVLVQTDLFSAVGVSRAGPREVRTKVPRFMASQSIKPFIFDELRYGLENPISFRPPTTGAISYGYPATLLVDICNAILEAKKHGALRKNQEKMAESCDILVRSIAKVGIIALVDEATGFQRIRAERALATILEKFIADELQPWTKTFQYEFYENIFRLKGWDGPHGTKRPVVIAQYANDLVYSRLAPGVLEELRRKNPSIPDKGRKYKHHQWFTPEFGHPKLKEHLLGVMALMRGASNWDSFKRSIKRAYPKQDETLPLAYPDDI